MTMMEAIMFVIYGNIIQ
ncbi:Hypothetical protein SSCIU_00477 [Mammaliicoccus sciuri]|nr:Hypothetical protein SSCIU_00477 [Mammaliicoccus sciuri]